MDNPSRPKAPTLKDLAREAGVSLTSASYAINGTGSVGPKTRAHVLEVAKRIGFRLNLTARTMKSGRSGMLALVIPDLGNPFFAALVQAVFREARSAGYHIYMTNTEGSEELEADALAMAVGLRVDGLIWFSIRDKDTSGGILSNTPTILLDRTVPGYDTVSIDYYDAGRRAADHLLAHGHRRVGIVSGPMDIVSMRDRCAGFRDRLIETGELVFEVENSFSLDLEPGAKAAVLERRATAIFAGADIIGIGIMRHAQVNGIDVPRALSVVGFDDIDLASLVSPALTTVEIPIEEIAARSVALLLERISGQRGELSVEKLPARVVERESVSEPG
ncbi:LacI family DNA-binding transcriptional regulator [Sphingomonas sp. H39-1-10]|nr:LacI family DNA-binding transcriptional regulator [Sphingomonas pollutisoli]MDF0488882.1 LacI family DNA-binding transcriptional regulator [Sphingomonas pollutisoli]SDA19832.1 transcriptional regulator, LacI family [Sphingomonas sp. NFR15]